MQIAQEPADPIGFQCGDVVALNDAGVLDSIARADRDLCIQATNGGGDRRDGDVRADIANILTGENEDRPDPILSRGIQLREVNGPHQSIAIIFAYIGAKMNNHGPATRRTRSGSSGFGPATI
jgi:hypothetical protein